ncbi:MAG: DUF4272 domain-containing protein [Cellvibrionaceae bacterium]
MEPLEIKKESEKIVLSFGGEICDWLPVQEITEMRSKDDIIRRALIMNAMINIAFDAPIDYIAGYIEKNKLRSYLSSIEIKILQYNQEALPDQHKINLHWYLESLWALLWVMGKIDSLDFICPIPDTMIEYCPKLQEDEGPEKFTEVPEVRSFEEVYRMRDVYYRAMWCSQEFQLRNTPKENFNMGLIMERRRSLTWCLDKTSDWDDISQDT